MTMPDQKRTRGYDQLFVAQVMAAQPATPATELGRHCVTCNVPVEQVARDLGVTRMTVYAWFTGRRKPRPKKLEAIVGYLASLQSHRP